jgi:hypothetical protein
MLRGTQKTNSRANRHGVRLSLWVVGMILVVLGCEVDEGTRPESRYPDTFLFVHGDTLNTVHYRQIISWWGTDTDGEVEAYLYQLTGPWEPDPSDSIWAGDPSWIWTDANADTFDFPVEGSFAERTFRVRAVDDDGLIDRSPAEQVFRVENFPPSISWSGAFTLPTRSLPAVSFAWSPEDPDGRETVTRAFLWIESGQPGDSARTVRIVEGDTIASVLPEQFEFGVSREYTLKVQAIDDAATKSNILEHTWNVEWPPSGVNVLLIDNVDSDVVPGGRREDLYYQNLVMEVTGNSVHLVDVPSEGGFRSDKEVLPIFSLFETVIWYSGISDGGTDPNTGDFGEGENDRSMRENLEKAEEGIRQYLELGGDVFISATNLFGDLGGLSSRFFHDVAGLDTLYSWIDPERGFTSDIELPRDNVMVSPTVLDPGADPLSTPDTLGMRQKLLRVDYFSSPPPEERTLWLVPGTLDTTFIPRNKYSEFHCGVRKEVGLGKLVLTAFPLSRADAAGNHEDVGRALLEWLMQP